MKTILLKTQLGMATAIFAAVTLSQSATAKDFTAYDLAKEGNRYVGEQSKDKVVQIRSEKSVGSLAPEIWYVVYYDPDAPLKAVEVKFGAGQKMDVRRPTRLLEPITNADEPLLKDKLKIDSNDALKIASQQPLLDKLTLKATKLNLERHSTDDATPVWKVKVWAAKLKNPNDNTYVGEVVLSAEDGKVMKSDLKPDRVD